MLDTAQTEQLDALCKHLGRAGDGQTRVTVILPSGKVVADSGEGPARMKDHSDRPEIIDAREKGVGWSLRPSPTLGIKMMCVAAPIREQAEVQAVVRTSIAATAIDQTLTNMYTKILWGGLAGR